MKKAILTVLFVIASVSLASAAINLTFTNPTEGQEFSVGDVIPISFTSDKNVYWVQTAAFSNNYRFIIRTQDLRPGGAFSYSTQWNTTGFPSDNYSIYAILSYWESRDNSSATSKSVQIVLSSGTEQPGSDTNSVRLVRSLPEKLSPKGFIIVALTILPKKDFSGIVITEKIPSGLTLITTLGQDAKYDRQTREYRILLKSSTKIGPQYVSYMLEDTTGFPPETIIKFDGNWEILGESGQIIGDKEAKFAGFRIPDCPLSDTVLLEHIEKWKRKELDSEEFANDRAIQQIILRWKGTC